MQTQQEIRKIVEKYSDMLFHICLAYLKNKDDAQDTVQEIFLSYIKIKPDFESCEHEKAWLIRVAINKCKNLLRSNTYRRYVSIDDLNENVVMDREEVDLLNEILELPEKYKIVIHLYYYENLSINEISKVLKKSSNSVGTLLRRGRELIKKSLD